uniref:HTH La-type RNA-binding domain-containing protein n=1 Tax=Piliocolobus tephrosceles TaxID=591936 RepID=A0A8C9IIR0_9PRIM
MTAPIPITVFYLHHFLVSLKACGHLLATITENGENEKMAALEVATGQLNRLTTDFNVLVEVLSKSKAELMEISEDKTKIRRSPSKPLREVTDKCLDERSRSVYIKGFPTDANLDGMKEWLEDKDQVLNIQMRRTVPDNTFQGRSLCQKNK